MCIYIRTHRCIFAYTCIYTHMYIYIYISAYTYTHISLFIFKFVNGKQSRTYLGTGLSESGWRALLGALDQDADGVLSRQEPLTPAGALVGAGRPFKQGPRPPKCPKQWPASQNQALFWALWRFTGLVQVFWRVDVCFFVGLMPGL